jgi:hypothetical protein
MECAAMIEVAAQKTLWYSVPGLASEPQGITRYLCADGDGIVTLEEIDGFFNLVDQGTHIKKLGRDLSNALRVAESYLHTNYRAIYETCLINY